MSDPLKKANFTRNCWIEFANEEHCEKALLSMNGLMIKNETLNVSKASTKVRKVKVLKNYPSSRIDADADAVAKLI
jgi:RNA recognition motif-containing protein